MIITLLNIYCKWKFTDTLHIFYEVLAFKKLHVYQMIINESFQHEESYILSNISFWGKMVPGSIPCRMLS